MNQPDMKERALLAEIQADQQALEAGLDRARQFERDAESELTSLKSELPNVLFNCMTGTGDAVRKLEIRSRIRELTADLEELPFLDTGFEKERAKIRAKQNQERLYRSKRRSFEELKQRLTDDPRRLGIGTREQLHLFAKVLDCTEDAEAFLESLERGTAA
ncbi:MAG: hypothetical protein ABFS45_12185 [Pseudomonadota bacterium]